MDPQESTRIAPPSTHSKDSSFEAVGRVRAALGALTGPEARNGAFTLADQAVASGTNFLAGVAVGRSCSKEEFGLYALGFTAVVFLLNLQNTLVSLPYTVNCPGLPPGERKGYTSSSLLHQLAFSALCAATLFLAGWAFAASGGPGGLSGVLHALAIAMPFLLLREYSRQLNFAWLRGQSALAVDLATAAAYLGGLWMLARWMELSAARTFILSGAACLLAAVGWLFRTRREFSFGSARPVPDFLRNWKLSRWPLAALLANLASMQLYPWFLAGFHGTEVTGVFSACMGTILLVNPFVIGMGNYLGPRIVHAHALEGAKATRDVVRKGILAVLAVLAPFCLFMVIFGDLALRTIYGAKFGGNGEVVALLAVGQFVDLATFPMATTIFVLGRPEAVFRCHFAALLVTGTAGLLLVRYFGLVGAAAAMTAAGATASLYRWSIYRAAMRASLAGRGR